ncbi:MAG: M20/M25/M40 family metallo-hydrolase [Chloroflexi bacterium]|nr:M20/M25/M40 family metallo-hydrolase [Chloroflexota bacterium]
MDNDLVATVLDLAAAIQQIPAPTFDEARRAEFVRQRFLANGVEEVFLDAAGNVLARLPGKTPGAAPLVVSAHLDTVFSADTDLTLRREADWIQGPGIGDNSLGVAGLFGLLWALRRRHGAALPFSGDLWLAANVGEEGMGNLRGMSALVERFGAAPRAYIVLEGMSLGYIYHRGLAVYRWRIAARTAGGHSWVDYGQPSAIHALAGLIARLDGLVVPQSPRCSLNVGVIGGGSTVNSIAAEAWCLLDLRSEEAAALRSLSAEVEAQAHAANREGVRFSIEEAGSRPCGEIPLDHPLVRLAQRALQAHCVRPLPSIGSTDANLPLSYGLPAVCIGLTLGRGAHTPAERIQTRPLAQGLAALLTLVESLY